MKRAIILEGRPFDWDEGAEAMKHVVNADGTINHRAAMCADPGVTKCPKCSEYFWAEGVKLRCSECGNEFYTHKKQ